jgi:hypothetical protein
MSFVKNPTSRPKNYLIFSALVLLSVVILLIIILFETLVANQIIQDRRDRLLPSEYYDFYKEESRYVHHLRALDKDRLNSNLYQDPRSLFYSTLGHGKTKVLIQGDSWAEQFYFTRFSREKLQEFTAVKDTTIYIAGTSSYSPSLMTAQMNRLRRFFDLDGFSHVIAVIDQTDLGDELCRYRVQRQYTENGLIVKPYLSSDSPLETYNTTLFFENLNVIQSDSLNTLKLFRLAFNKLSSHLPENRMKCGWSEIERPLIHGLTSEEVTYMKLIILEYIEEVFKSKSVSTLILVTYPHRQHLTGEYKFDIHELLQEVIVESPYTTKIINFRPVTPLVTNAGSSDIYMPDDRASHLTDRAHALLLTVPLLEKLGQLASEPSR